jgi:hypothetical protein
LKASALLGAAIGSLALTGCTDYEQAVECSAVYGVAAERVPDTEYIRLRDLAERDALRKAEPVGKSQDDVAAEIDEAMRRERSKSRRGTRLDKNKSLANCDAFYE